MAHRKTTGKFRRHLLAPCQEGYGYVVQAVHANVPSTSLADLTGLTLDWPSRQVSGDQGFGDDADIEVRTNDEISRRVKPKRTIGRIRATDGRGLAALVPVRSDPYPRALDIARHVRAAE